MDSVVQTWGKTYVEISILRTLGKKTESEDFYLENVAWCFDLDAKWDKSCNDEKWTMHFKMADPDDVHRNCRLTAYVRDKESDYLFMVSKEITQPETEIWSYTRRSFFDTYPKAKYDEDELTFMFSFDFGIPCLKGIRRFETDDKSVQTSPFQDHRLCLKHLSLDLRKLMDEGQNTDVLLRCRNCIIPAHKLILGARSEVFRTMVQSESDMVEGKEGSVEILDMETMEFEIFVRYLYTGILPEMTEDSASSLYEAGDKYRVDALRERCGDLLANNLTPENACDILVMADAHSDKDLKQRVVSYIIDEEIPKKDEWSNFCKNYSVLAVEVLNRAYEQLSCNG